MADDHTLIREGLHALLARAPGLDVVGEACNGRDAVSLARQLKPDVVVLDVSMPDLNGMEAARRIKAENPKARILALSMHSEHEFIGRMLDAGALGYLLKDSGGEELMNAVNHVARNEVYLDKAIARELLLEYVQGPS